MIKMYKILIGYPAMFPPNELLNEKQILIENEAILNKVKENKKIKTINIKY